jgi:hypothetical protein
MTRFSYTFLAMLAATSVASRASAQFFGYVPYSYARHSTVAGDYFGGAAELVRAHGAYERDLADAAETWVRVSAASDAAAYQRAEYHFQLRQRRDEYRKQLAEERTQRYETRAAQRIDEARRIWTEAQNGLPLWPAALERPEFAASVRQIESILEHWTPDNSPLGDAYRRALTTEIGVVRARVTTDQRISFADRVAAVRILNSLELFAKTAPAVALDGRVAMR